MTSSPISLTHSTWTHSQLFVLSLYTALSDNERVVSNLFNFSKRYSNRDQFRTPTAKLRNHVTGADYILRLSNGGARDAGYHVTGITWRPVSYDHTTCVYSGIEYTRCGRLRRANSHTELSKYIWGRTQAYEVLIHAAGSFQPVFGLNRTYPSRPHGLKSTYTHGKGGGCDWKKGGRQNMYILNNFAKGLHKNCRLPKRIIRQINLIE